jgi:signal transduction histidine kinase
MRRRLPAGLRWRLLLALIATSAITLAVAALVVLQPLQSRLRDQSAENLVSAVVAARQGFSLDLARKGVDREIDVAGRSRELSDQTDSRVMVAERTLLAPDGSLGFFSDTEIAADIERPLAVAIEVQRVREVVVDQRGDVLRVGIPIYDKKFKLAGIVVAQHRLTEVSTLIGELRNRLLAAALVGLFVAVILAIGLSSTLLRRLGRLRTIALRISREGPDVPFPQDTRRDEVGDLARTLARMQEELRRQEAARRAFVSTASHELRTPLTMLQGTMELLEEDLADGRLDLDDAQRQVATARRELRRLSVLAGELLDLSRLDAQVPLRSEPVELGELARAVAAEFELAGRERDLTIDAVPPDGPCWARGDPDAVARVVRILLDNALRYGPPGEAVRVLTGSYESHVTLDVIDRGPGIPSEEHEHIFERFHRGAAAGSEGGFGLGLAIGRELARRMGGDLELAESYGRGARFVLILRAAAPSPGGSPARDSVAAG